MQRKVELVILEQSKGLSLTLPEGSCLNQYHVLSVAVLNGESCVYNGLDAEGKAVWIREFLPQKMVHRDGESLDLVPSEDAQTIYKYSLAAFEELYQLLKNAGDLEHILQVRELFYAHNTVYAVEQAQPVKSFKEHVSERGLPFSWTEAKKLMLPLMNSISQLHDRGIVHLGIAPENLCVTEDGRLLLSGFSTLEARAADGELDQELYSGFSSPEQYSGGDWKGGPCSDVYSLGAVLYWLLTGEVPASADQRMEQDSLPCVAQKNPSVPENVSDAISGAMMLDSSLRCASVDDFTSGLLESVSGNTTVYEVPTVPNEHTVHLETEMPQKRKIGRILLGTAAFLLLTLALAAGVHSLVTKKLLEDMQQEENSESQEQLELFTVPDFVGHQYQDILNNKSYSENFVFSTVMEYSDKYPEGVIVAQSVAKNTQAPKSTAIVLTVSKGKETVSMPNLIGWGLAGAKQQLDELGIAYSVYVVENKNYTPNTVFRTDPPGGTQIAASDGIVAKIYVTPEQAAQEESSTNSKKDKNTTKNQD